MVLSLRFADEIGKNLNMTNIIYPVFNYYRYDLNNSGQFLTFNKQLEFTSCDKILPSKKELSSFDLKSYYCVNWEDYNLTFGGSWDATFIEFFQLTLYSCPNSMPFYPDANCTDINSIKDYLKLKIILTLKYSTQNIIFNLII